MSNRIYDEFVPYYDLVYRDRQDEIEFYRSLLPADATSALELGCGTGTLTVGVAEQLRARHGNSANVVGLDHSLAMLRAARHQDARIHWVLGDMSDPPLAGPFDFVFCGFNTLQMLASDEAVLSTMKSGRGLLGKAGLFVFDIYNPSHVPDPSQPSRRTGRLVSSFTDIGGHHLQILEDATEAADGRSVRLDWRLTERTLASSEPRARLIVQLRHYSRSIIDQMTRAAGLRIIQRFGDVRRTPFDEHSSVKQVVVCGR